MEIIIFTHNLITANLISFCYINEYGWCFNWYENEEDKKADCLTYGHFPKDFIDMNGDYEEAIIQFLATKSKDEKASDIPISEFINWFNSPNNKNQQL